MKRIFSLLIIALMLTGCSCRHEWNDASCDLPKTCSLCAETEGNALGHSWQDAACETPKTCAVCKLTEGEALGHDWQDATCEKEGMCTRCEAVRSSALGHRYGTWEYDGEVFVHTCQTCGNPESLSPEAFFIRQMTGTWQAAIYEDGGKGAQNPEHYITVLPDGTIELILNPRLSYPETAQLITEEFSYVEFPMWKGWRIVFYLENSKWWSEEMGEDVPKEWGLTLQADYSMDTGALSLYLLYPGYHDMWIFEEKQVSLP